MLLKFHGEVVLKQKKEINVLSFLGFHVDHRLFWAIQRLRGSNTCTQFHADMTVKAF